MNVSLANMTVDRILFVRTQWEISLANVWMVTTLPVARHVQVRFLTNFQCLLFVHKLLIFLFQFLFLNIHYIFSDIDECEKSIANCDDNAVCQNTAGSYVCDCKIGFIKSGLLCTGIKSCKWIVLVIQAEGLS